MRRRPRQPYRAGVQLGELEVWADAGWPIAEGTPGWEDVKPNETLAWAPVSILYQNVTVYNSQRYTVLYFGLDGPCP